jgi:hypothetical protein
MLLISNIDFVKEQNYNLNLLIASILLDNVSYCKMKWVLMGQAKQRRLAL